MRLLFARKKIALLISGGIGDFLHYIARIPAFLRHTGLSQDDFVICVESTVPEKVEEMFCVAFPKLAFWYTPGHIQWTRSNPLLIPYSRYERMHRPAYRYLLHRDVDIIEDWFLPFLCQQYPPDTDPIFRIISAAQCVEKPGVVASARDKGFLWWPSESADDALRRAVPSDREIVTLGTPDEQTTWMYDLTTPKRLIDALAISYHAELYVGTDTGVATIRELTQKANVYCIDRFWFKSMMLRYKYLNQASLSKIATNIEEMRYAILDYFESEQCNRSTMEAQ